MTSVQTMAECDVFSVGHDLAGTVFAYGFSLRKRPMVKRFVPNARVRFISKLDRCPAGAYLLVWGSLEVPADICENVTVVRIEDGFLRSVGLGADLVSPVSWVIDQRAIYYDATRPSDLEHLLQTASFSSELLERAGRLRERIVENRLTKYNLSASAWTRPPGEALVILVPGQVEADASIRFGALGIRSNMGLLRAVRVARPEAYIVYKPHPDVVAGLRARGDGEDEARRWCNELVVDVEMGDLLLTIDEVHVLTSLTGFEALLRGRKVTCYGQPFYSGWGLTTDVLPVPRRTRRLSLDALVAAALILYPTYVSRLTRKTAPPEQIMDELQAWRRSNTAGIPVLRRILRTILRVWRAWS